MQKKERKTNTKHNTCRDITEGLEEERVNQPIPQTNCKHKQQHIVIYSNYKYNMLESVKQLEHIGNKHTEET
jgi:hypothetical protein